MTLTFMCDDSFSFSFSATIPQQLISNKSHLQNKAVTVEHHLFDYLFKVKSTKSKGKQHWYTGGFQFLNFLLD